MNYIYQPALNELILQSGIEFNCNPEDMFQNILFLFYFFVFVCLYVCIQPINTFRSSVGGFTVTSSYCSILKTHLTIPEYVVNKNTVKMALKFSSFSEIKLNIHIYQEKIKYIILPS